MLEQPMIEKLLSMRLQGMADALKAQEQDPGVRELSFVERLSLLVDQQWNWRENQALARRLKSAKLRHNACIEDIDYRAARGTGKDRHSRTGEGFAVGPEPRESFRSRADRRGEELYRLRSGAESVPRWILGVLHTGGGAVPRSGAGTR